MQCEEVPVAGVKWGERPAPAPNSQFFKGLPMSSGKRGSGAGHKTSAATGPGLDGGFNSRHRVGFSGLGLTLTDHNIKGQGTCLGAHD